MSNWAIYITTNLTKQPQMRRPGTFVWETIPQTDDEGMPFLGALVNNEAVSLQARLDMSCTVKGLTSKDPEGWLILRRSMCFLLSMAAHTALPDARLRVMHSIGDGMFFVLRENGGDSMQPPSPESLKILEKTMHSIVQSDKPIMCSHRSYEEAVKLFTDTGQLDKVSLLRHINTPSVRIFQCGDYSDLDQGPIVSRTGILGSFKLVPYENGCMMMMPPLEDPSKISEFVPFPELMRVHREHSKWGEDMDIQGVGQLNDAVYKLQISDIIQMSEALHDKNFTEIANMITEKTPVPRVILIAGPSCAGKTTSAKRLGIHLRVNGRRPVLISTDDYFVGTSANPVDEDGNPDFEHVDAVDIKMFNEHLTALLNGETIKRRKFDFRQQSPVFTDEEMHLDRNSVLIVEGIHGLNPILTESVPREDKFLIFLSALTQMGIDDGNVLSTTDNRLMRRIVRDHLFRGHSALATIRMWPSVRRGEERWIFPYQDMADVSLNTALDYEVAVLRPYVEPLLAEIKPYDPEYTIARRIQKVLTNFHSILPTAVPGDSILREYIGGSLLKY
jgi:uridine kinase